MKKGELLFRDIIDRNNRKIYVNFAKIVNVDDRFYYLSNGEKIYKQYTNTFNATRTVGYEVVEGVHMGTYYHEVHPSTKNYILNRPGWSGFKYVES